MALPQEGKKIRGCHVNFGGGITPPPKPPFECPWTNKEGANLLPFYFFIHLDTHCNGKVSCGRVMKQKSCSGHSVRCVPTLPGTYNWPAGPQTPLLSSPSKSTLQQHIVPCHYPGSLEWIAA
eukprot:1157935-Pelagomonas_calceolata.AAC.10